LYPFDLNIENIFFTKTTVHGNYNIHNVTIARDVRIIDSRAYMIQVGDNWIINN